MTVRELKRVLAMWKDENEVTAAPDWPGILLWAPDHTSPFVQIELPTVRPDGASAPSLAVIEEG